MIFKYLMYPKTCEVAIVLMAFALTIALPALTTAGPRIRTTPETFDFGYLPEGQTVFHRYWLANDGHDTLVVELVKPQCGCTTVPLPTDRLAPGDSVPLDLSFNSKNIKGRVNKAVSIWSNDSTLYPAVIYFTGDIADTAQMIVASPPVASLISVDNTPQIIELNNTSEHAFKFGFATPPPAFLHCELSNDSLPPGQTATLTMTSGQGTPLGEYRTSVTLRCEGNITFPLTIPVKGVGYVQ